MSTPLTPAVLRQHVRAIRERHPDERVIGIQARDGWAGPATLDVGGELTDVIRVMSPLQARELISERAATDHVLVLLTDLDPRELGTDVICRLALRRLMIPDAWSLVVDAFRARDLDPRLLKHRWMAAALLESMPPDGYAPVAAGILDSETAWALVLERRLGLHHARPDATTLLEWLSTEGTFDQLRSLPEDMRAGVRAWLCESAGPAGLAMLEASTSAAQDLVALGLVCTALFDTTGAAYPEAREAIIRFEPFVGGRALPGRDAATWAAAALALLHQRGQDERRVRAWSDRADVILADLGAGGAAWRSDVLPRGFEQRCERTADAIDRALAAHSTPGAAREEAIAAATESIQRLKAHQLSDSESHGDRLERLTMALRLVHWMIAVGAKWPTSLALAAADYVSDTAFADWARTVIRGGDPSAKVTAMLGRVASAARDLREAQELRFAVLFAEWLDAGSSGVLLSERVIAEIVVPTAQAAPVLFIVLDGMNGAVFHELSSSLLGEGWVPIAPAGRTSPEAVVTVVPSVTEYCRTSLFSGSLVSGAAGDERAAFSTHPLLLAHSQSERPPILFHKGELGDATSGLPGFVRDEIGSSSRRVVAVVVNAVDDHLLKADQVRSRWNLASVPLLRSLLHAAREGGRLVVLTSDHGHVLESGTSARTGGVSDRWRPVNGAAGEGEVVLRGPRVLTDSHECVAAAGEGVRYRTKKNGYHGGASAQEVIVPLAVFASSERTLDGWQETGLVRPGWWELFSAAEQAPVVQVARAASPGARPGPIPAPLLQIAEQESAAHAAPAVQSIADLLLASAVFRAQRDQQARVALDDARIRAFLDYLIARGGRATRPAVAAQLGLPPFRVSSQLAALRTLLNVDAYPVLSIDEPSDTVELNVTLLRTQFEL